MSERDRRVIAGETFSRNKLTVPTKADWDSLVASGLVEVIDGKHHVRSTAMKGGITVWHQVENFAWQEDAFAWQEDAQEVAG